jgi:hypothetical protein
LVASNLQMSCVDYVLLVQWNQKYSRFLPLDLCNFPSFNYMEKAHSMIQFNSFSKFITMKMYLVAISFDTTMRIHYKSELFYFISSLIWAFSDTHPMNSFHFKWLCICQFALLLFYQHVLDFSLCICQHDHYGMKRSQVSPVIGCYWGMYLGFRHKLNSSIASWPPFVFIIADAIDMFYYCTSSTYMVNCDAKYSY